MASTGFMLAAFAAGSNPANKPIRPLIPVEIKMFFKDKKIPQSVKELIAKTMSETNPNPNNPPARESKTDSNKN